MMVQLRWNNGQIKEHKLNSAWQMFMDDSGIWKISWNTPNGKRLRIVKSGLAIPSVMTPDAIVLEAGYIEPPVYKFNLPKEDHIDYHK